ncbi:MAG TPA: hypothetical protein VGE34_03585 [Candidatus Saccharimonadales bacterium]
MTDQHELEVIHFGLYKESSSKAAENLSTPASPEGYEHDPTSIKAMNAAAQRARVLSADGGEEHEALNKRYGRVICANCNTPGCPGCGRS